jgi:hypothetical protein
LEGHWDLWAEGEALSMEETVVLALEDTGTVLPRQ